MTVSYNASLDIWHLSHDGEGGEHAYLDLPAGDFTVLGTVIQVPSDIHAGAGLVLMGAEGPLLYLLVSQAGTEVSGLQTFSLPPIDAPTVHLKIEYVGDQASCFMSSDGNRWLLISKGPLERPADAGIVLRYTDEGFHTEAKIAWFRVLDGLIDPTPVVVGTTAAVPVQQASIGVMSYVEPVLHAIIGAPFGDLELDVGKSVRWIMWLTDRQYVLDVNIGTPRYWVVDWAETFPESLHGITSINYFKQPEAFRKEQFARAEKAWNYDDEDWVIFCDAAEGLSVDNRTEPDDWAMDPFRSYIYREIQRAIDASQDWACLPYFAFVKHTEVANIAYPISAVSEVPVGEEEDDEVIIIEAVQPIAVPYYIPMQGMRRLVKVSALRNPAFDWTTLDVPAAPDAGAKLQIVSYAYAHWNPLDIVPPATEPDPISATNDDGWKMRQLISQVRPVAGLPFTDPWKDPSLDADGLVGPPADAVSYTPIDITDPRPPITIDPACAGITSPLYDQVIRLNLRDGIWYESDGLGNIPLQWNDATQVWEPAYPADEWHSQNWEQVPQ